MCHLKDIFKKAIFIILAISVLCFSGCAMNNSNEQDNVAQNNQKVLKPGVAVPKRDKNVKYSVPEGVSVLMYHMIGDIPGNDAVMTEKNLRMQMQYLKDNGYHPITMQELYDYVSKGAALPEKPVCITFDDGYHDSYTIVYPMMKEFNFPWTLFLITDDVGKAYNRMTWEELKEMADSNTVTIANHTLSHPKLHNLSSRKEKENQIEGAQKALKYHLNIDNAWIAYPYGDYDEEVIDICIKAGIKLALTTDAGRVHEGSYPYELKRVYIGNNVDMHHFAERLMKDDYSTL